MKLLVSVSTTILLSLLNHVALAQFTPSPQVFCGGPQGHCYRRVNIATCTSYSWEAVSSYALGASYGNWPGHLLTVESGSEWNSGMGSNDGYIGALGGSNGPYAWAVGPSAGAPVQIFGPWVPAGGACAPFSTIKMTNNVYFAASPVRAGTSGCNSGACIYGDNFFIEYEPDVVAPTASMTTPAGGENYPPGSTAVISWHVEDRFGSLGTVDLDYSPVGPGGPFSPVARGLSPSGTTANPITRTALVAAQAEGAFQWLVPCDATTQGTIRITVRDAAGNATSTTNAAAFGVLSGDCPTPGYRTSWGRLKIQYR